MVKFVVKQGGRRLLALFSFVVLGAGASAAPICSRDQADAHGPLYRVEKNGRSALLFGTVHNSTNDMLKMIGEKVAPLIDQSDVLVTENGLPQGGLPITFRQSIKAQAPISETLGPERVAAWNAVTHNANTSQMRDINLLFYIARNQSSVSNALGINREFIAEDVLMQRAEQAGKPLMRLETDVWVQEMAKIPAAQWRQYTDRALAFLKADPHLPQDDAYRQLVQLWQRGDIDAIQARAVSDERKMVGNGPLLWNQLLDRRTAQMADKVEQFIADPHGNRYFIAVGAGHLGGRNGLVALLKQRGYTVNCQ